MYDDWDVVEKHLNSLKYSIQSFKFIASPIQTPHYLASATGRDRLTLAVKGVMIKIFGFKYSHVFGLETSPSFQNYHGNESARGR